MSRDAAKTPGSASPPLPSLPDPEFSIAGGCLGRKRRRSATDDDSQNQPSRPLSQPVLNSLGRPISPPASRRRSLGRSLDSPWRLTRIRDLPEASNQGAIGLGDLLADPLIYECWQFNYLHDVPFIMAAFDPDVRHLVRLHLVHGFWKSQDARGLALTQAAAHYPNVSLHVAPMPEPFGTHHSKMMVLFRRDDTAQVIIHTANMIAQDWTNLTNALWLSPRLPKLTLANTAPGAVLNSPAGSGDRFKADLLAYLRSYDARRPTCTSLVRELIRYDFSAVRAALVASVPGRHSLAHPSGALWGWASLQRCLQAIPSIETEAKPEIVLQVSSIATLGGRDDWLRKTVFRALAAASASPSKKEPTFKLVFPTADEIRRSLDGYASGASIHTKIQSQQQARQLEYLRPLLYHWSHDSEKGRALPPDCQRLDGGRNRAAPHIKTYIRYNGMTGIDWALLTSANLSKQAWGEAVQSTGEMRIASWEIGVLLWPDLYGKDASMVATFQTDRPSACAENSWSEGREAAITVGLRIPYSKPLQRYGPGEIPWVATSSQAEPDRWGKRWEG